MEPHSNDIDWLIAQLLAGRGSSADWASFAAWAGDDAVRQRLFQQVRALAGSAGVATVEVDRVPQHAAWIRLADTIERQSRKHGTERTRATSESGTRSVRSIRSLRIPLGALAIILVAIGAFLFRGSRSSAPAQHYQTAFGQRSTVHLADGTVMILAPATSVTVTSTTVTVAGEAYFTIAPKKSRPFVVHTRNAVVQVLGTRFAVRQYPGESRSRVVVEDGRVSLQPVRHGGQPPSRSDTRTVLSARMLAQVTDSGVTVTSGIATRDYTNWTHGTLVFDRVALRDVVEELIRAYGTDIRIADTVLAKQEMRMEVSVQEQPLTRILELIGEATDAHYTKQGGAYILAPGHVATQSPTRIPQRHQFPQPERQYGR